MMGVSAAEHVAERPSVFPRQWKLHVLEVLRCTAGRADGEVEQELATGCTAHGQ